MFQTPSFILPLEKGEDWVGLYLVIFNGEDWVGLYLVIFNGED